MCVEYVCIFTRDVLLHVYIERDKKMRVTGEGRVA